MVLLLVDDHVQMTSYRNTPFLGGYNNIPPSHVGRGYKTYVQFYYSVIFPTQKELSPF